MKLLPKKYFNYEYWPSFMFYLPNIPYAFYLAIKSRSLTFFKNTNPAIRFSGNGTESKFKTLNLLPKLFVPKSVFIKKNNPLKSSLSSIYNANISFPLIAKPDIGFKGLLVQLIKNENDLKNYLNKYNSIAIIIQEYINFPNECGIFYVKMPSEKSGKITSITLKNLPTITGNGISTLEELIQNDSKIKLYSNLFKKLDLPFQSIIEKDKKIVLNVVGNHCKGSTFLNGNFLISNELEDSLNALFNQIPEFYYGRLDIKYDTFENLLNLKNFKIIELNGIISEPTHIYDSTKVNYFEALKSIREHWNYIYKIAKLNHKKSEVNSSSLSIFIKSLIDLKNYIKHVKKLSI
ncbi:MAG: D-alanine--D-alanine ligase [Lutibacter sp.]